MKVLCIILMVLTTVALVFYPFVIMANLMAVADYPAGNPGAPFPLAGTLFVWFSSLYPLPWLICLIASIWQFRHHLKRALIWQLSLVAYLLLTGLFLLLWFGLL